MARGVEVVVPEIADYEVRRELTRINALGHSVVSIIWLLWEDCRISLFRLALGVTPPSSEPTPASVAYQPLRLTPSTPT